MSTQARPAPRRTREEIRQTLKEIMKKMNFKDATKAKEDAANALMQYPFLRSTEGTVRLPQSGVQVRAIKLAGTVGMKYKGKEYFIPCAIYITEEYPKRGPIAHVEPTPTMVIKQQHMHVDQTGLCYLPYLHEWNKKSSHIIGCVEALAEVFSRDPFIYSRPAAQPAPPAPAPAPAPAPVPYGYPTWNQPPQGAAGLPPYMTGGGAVAQPPMPSYAQPMQPPPIPQPPLPFGAGLAAAATRAENDARPRTAEGPVDMAKRVEELESKLQEDKLCVVCVAEPKNALIVPCGHVAMCMGCAELLRTTGKACPVCRGNIQQLVKAYVV